MEPPEQLLSIPTEGDSPLPFTEGTEFLDGPLNVGTNPKGSAAAQSQSAPKANWEHLNPLLEAAVRQSGSQYAALFSVQDSSGNYHYSHNALEFPDAMVEAAGGAAKSHLYYLSSDDEQVRRVALVQLPDAPGSIEAFEQWLDPVKDIGVEVNKTSKKVSGDTDTPVSQDLCYVYFRKCTNVGLCGLMLEITISCHGRLKNGGDSGRSPWACGCHNAPVNIGGGGGSGGVDTNKLPNDFIKNDIFTTTKDTTDINCDEENNEEWEQAWCQASIPKGEKFQTILNALDNIEKRGENCRDIAQKGRSLLADNKLRIFPQNGFSFGGKGGPNIGVLLSERWFDFVNSTALVTDVDGRNIRINFEFALAHEIDHALGSPHILASNGMESQWLTLDSLPCSGL